jgi:hypothetical protein
MLRAKYVDTLYAGMYAVTRNTDFAFLASIKLRASLLRCRDRHDAYRFYLALVHGSISSLDAIFRKPADSSR